MVSGRFPVGFLDSMGSQGPIAAARMECLKLIASSKFAEKRVGGDPRTTEPQEGNDSQQIHRICFFSDLMI
jgi:hypothetical protein